MLLENGAEPNQANNNELALLMIACLKGHIGVARLLLENGADAEQVGNDGEILYAGRCGHAELAMLLSGAERSENVTEDTGQQLLNAFALLAADMKFGLGSVGRGPLPCSVEQFPGKVLKGTFNTVPIHLCMTDTM